MKSSGPRYALSFACSLSFLFCPVSVFGQSLSLEPTSLDFGVIKLGAATTLDARLHNQGSADQEMKITVSGEAFTTDVDTLTLAAGATVDIPVAFVAATLGEHVGTLAIHIDGFFKKEPMSIDLRGQVAHPRLTMMSKLEFSSLPVGSASSAAVEIANTGPVPMQIDGFRVEPDSADFTTQASSALSLDPDAKTAITVQFKPTTGGERFATLVILSGDLASGSAELALKGFSTTPRAAFSPRPEVGLEFDQLEVGQRRSRHLTILNHGRAALNVEGIELAGGPFTVDWDSTDNASVPADGRLDVRVGFRPHYEGQANGNLTVITNDLERPRVDIPLTGRAAVTPPVIEILNEGDMNFGNIALNKTATDFVVVWNRGGAPFTVRLGMEAELAGEFEIETASVLLQPAAFAKVQVRFKPRERGERRATLTVETESGAQPIAMYGIGHFLELAPVAVDFDRVVVGKSNPQQIELLNLGNADFTITNIRSSNTANFRIKSTVSAASKFVLPAHGYQSLPVSITFTPTARGLVNGILQVEGYWEEAFETRELMLSGTGIAADLELHPSANVEFGYVVIGEEEARTLVATNTGDTQLRVIARPESPEARALPDSFSLEPGESTTLQVILAPQALGQRSARVRLISNDVKEKALPLNLTGKGALGNVDLADVVSLLVSRKSQFDTLEVGWNNTPVSVLDQSKIDLVFSVPDSLRPGLVGREFNISWQNLDDNYDETGSAKNTKLKIHDSGEDHFLAEKFNLRLTEKDTPRVRVSIATRNHAGAPEQKITQVLAAGGWKWEFEAKPLVSFLSIRPGRDYKDADGNTVKGETERLIGLPGLAFFGYHNSQNPSISGIHLTATGNVLEALSTDNSLAISVGVAVSMSKDRFMFGVGLDVYDHRPRPIRKGTQDYIMTFKYWGLF